MNHKTFLSIFTLLCCLLSPTQQSLIRNGQQLQIVHFVTAAYHTCFIQHTQSFNRVFVTSCVITSHPPLTVSHMGRCLSSWTACWWSRPACVLINVCQFICMWVCTLVSKGWDRQWREQRLLVPEVRSACRHDTLPFSRTPAANIHTHTYTQNGLTAPAAPSTPSTAVVGF